MDQTRSRSAAKEFFSRTKMDEYSRRTRQECSPRLWFDTEVVDLAAEMFSGDPDFVGLGTFPRLKSVLHGHQNDGAADQAGRNRDEAEPIRFYHKIRCKSQFALISDFIADSASFRQAARHIRSIRLRFPGFRNNMLPPCLGEAAEIVRLNALDGLQALREILNSCVVFAGSRRLEHYKQQGVLFSTGSHSSSNNGKDMSNLHIVAFQMMEKHTGLYTYQVTERVMSALDLDWKKKVVGVASDGAANMTGIDSGRQTRVQKACVGECDSPFFRIWCGNHQLDLVDKVIIAAMDKAESENVSTWLCTLHATVKYLRKQYYLIDGV
jgi:hypothetical protein